MVMVEIPSQTMEIGAVGSGGESQVFGSLSEPSDLYYWTDYSSPVVGGVHWLLEYEDPAW